MTSDGRGQKNIHRSTTEDQAEPPDDLIYVKQISPTFDGFGWWVQFTVHESSGQSEKVRPHAEMVTHFDSPEGIETASAADQT